MYALIHARGGGTSVWRRNYLIADVVFTMSFNGGSLMKSSPKREENNQAEKKMAKLSATPIMFLYIHCVCFVLCLANGTTSSD